MNYPEYWGELRAIALLYSIVYASPTLYHKPLVFLTDFYGVKRTENFKLWVCCGIKQRALTGVSRVLVVFWLLLVMWSDITVGILPAILMTHTYRHIILGAARITRIDVDSSG